MMRFLIAVIVLIWSGGVLASVLGIGDHDKMILNSQGELEVCWWGRPTSETLPLRDKIENYLQSQISQATGLRLRFYGDCFKLANPFHAVGIGFFDAKDNPLSLQNAFLGEVQDRDTPGHPMAYSKASRSHQVMVDLMLTAHFKHVSPTLEKQAAGLSPQGKENLLLSIALHEFMHVLGFNHEQNRADSVCKEGQEVFRPQRARLLTEYDPESIMNYCQTRFYDFEKGTLGLSKKDLEGLRYLMGRYL